MKFSLQRIDSDFELMHGIHANEYEVITDLNAFLEDVALGISDVDELLLSKRQLSEDITSLISSDLLVFTEELLLARANEAIEQSLSEKEIEKVTKHLSSTYTKTSIPDDSDTISMESTTQHQTQTMNTTQEHTGFFSRLFRRKPSITTDLDIDVSTNIANQLRNDTSRGSVLRKHLLDNKYLTQSQLNTVDKKILEASRYGKKKYILQVCRELKYLSEDDAATLLQFTKSKEVISKTILISNLENLRVLNSDLKRYTHSYFILDISKPNMEIRICKDMSEDFTYHELDELYPNYTITQTDVVEGVTSEIWSLLDLEVVSC